ncbi:hypothetical protein SY83_10440 [Paenibacillus swuensis]|uniref:Uncharacterized protein n=1 Tax=Paenibacillus swuensis TaxID=1178515 RepID=A0A172THT3_9BACL|nr:hypothetical protein [Paenibacillus swuensis]ANE46619.1 hypothetical protein SY83_10440 [Paenibacillus swuensis]
MNEHQSKIDKTDRSGVATDKKLPKASPTDGLDSFVEKAVEEVDETLHGENSGKKVRGNND